MPFFIYIYNARYHLDIIKSDAIIMKSVAAVLVLQQMIYRNLRGRV